MSVDPSRSFSRSHVLTARSALIQSQAGSPVTIAWQSEEPTSMGLDCFRRAVKLVERSRGPGLVEHTIETDGTLLTDEWCDFFAEKEFLVSLSLDGPASVYDENAWATHHHVLAAARMLAGRAVDFNVLCRVHTANAEHPLEVYRYLRDVVRPRFIQFIPIVERAAAREGDLVTERSVRPEQWGRFLIEVFDEWVRRDVGTVFVQMYDAALASWLNGNPARCGYTEDTLPTYCRACRVRFACDGESPSNRFTQTPDGEPGLNYLCAGYRDFFIHIDGPMHIMAALLRSGHSADVVMKVLADLDRQGRQAQVYRKG